MPGSTLRRLHPWPFSGPICSLLLLALGCASPGGTEDSAGSELSREEQRLIQRAQRAAERGDPAAQAYLGTMYSQGQGVAEDPALAMSWYTMAADQGHATAQYNVGVLYATGRGAPQDHALASAWFRKAAEQGLPEAQMQLAANHYIGRGVPWDPTEAQIWFGRAAEGLPSLQRPEAIRYRDQALELVRLLEAANEGRGDAQLVLGELYAKGGAVPLDPIEAYRWLSLASTSDDAETRLEATKALSGLAEQMTPAQIDEARRRSAEWSQVHPSE